MTAAEAERYAAALRRRAAHAWPAAASWPARPLLEADPPDALPRVNLSVKVTALTPLLRAEAPERGHRGRRARDCATCFGVPASVGAHLHVDMESIDSREADHRARRSSCSTSPSSPTGPSAGIVLQAYLRDRRGALDHHARARRGGPTRDPR